MNEVKLVCPSCGQTFQAGANQKQAFCVNCGTMIDRTAEVAASGVDAPAKTTAELALDAARAAFAEVRFPVIDRKSGMKGDRLVGLWSTILFHSKNSRSSWNLKNARKEIGQYFDAKIWRPALELAGEQRAQLIADQLLDSAVVFLTTCRDDSRYGSKLMGVVRMNAADVAQKAADDICNGVISYLLHLERPGESDAMIYAAVMAYPRVFSTSRQVLADHMEAELTPEERQTALSIVTAIAEKSRNQ